LSVNADGSYHFELVGTLDHADPNDPNDIIHLDFGVSATDADGDSDSATLRIDVKDDVPRIGDAAGDVDESNLDVGPVVYTDTLEFNTGVEVGSITPAGNFVANANGSPLALTSGGVAVIVTQTANGYAGSANGNPVFTLTVNATTGQYTYTQFAPVDHPNTSDYNDTITLDFDVQITTIDNDSATATISIQVADDGLDARNDKNGAEEDQFVTGSVMDNDFVGEDNPNVVTNVHFNGTDYTVPAGGSVSINGTYGTLIMNSDGTYSYQATAEDPDGVENFVYTLRDGDGDTDTAKLDITVTPDGEPVAVSQFFDIDETNLTPGPMIYNGDLNVDFGRDGVGGVEGNGSFTAGASLANGQLTSNGVPVTVALVGNTYVGTAGATQVFTLTLNDDGTYQFHLQHTLDHADKTDPNDVIRLEFGVTISDADGDSADGIVTIHVHDDAPVAYADKNGAEEDQLITGNVVENDEIGEDNPNNVINVKFEGTDYAVPNGGSVSIAGTYGTLVMNSDGTYTYQATAEDPDGVEHFVYTLRDGDGDTDTATLDITVTPDGEPVAVSQFFSIDETNLTPGPMILNGDMNVDFGEDGVGGVVANGTFSAGDSLANGQLTSGGVPVIVTQTANGYVGMAGATQIFTLTIGNEGQYTFQLLGTLDHADGTDPNDAIQLDFGVTISDGDGDTANGQITVHVHDDAPVAYADKNGAEEDQLITGNVVENDEIGEDNPNNVINVKFEGTDYAVPNGGSVSIAGTYGTLVMNSDGTYTYQATAEDPDGVEHFVYTLRDGDGDTDTATLDITVTPDGEPVAVSQFFSIDETNLTPGPMILNGDMNVDFGEDGVGGVVANGTFSAGDSLANGQLTSGGVPVIVTQTANGYVGMAGATQIFTLTIGNEGQYTFQLLGTLDHADGTDPNDAIQLDFGVTISDGDGDTANGQITVHVHDDAPVAYADKNGAEEDQLITGNVVENDEIGEDNPNNVINVKFEGTDYAVPNGGSVSIAGTYGTLVMNSDGTYTYQATAEDPDGVEHFVYTLRDGDGDTDTATLDITVTPDGEPVAVSQFFSIDETNLTPGPMILNGDMNVDFGEDGVGGVVANGTFSAGDSLANGQLTSGGVPVIVTQTANGYVGMAGATQIFTLTIGNEGQYTFQLLGTLDHADGTDPNDAIQLDFGVTISDGDGDTANGQITVHVHDDAPVAYADINSVDEDQIVTGNVTNNDEGSEDTANTVTSVRFEGTDYAVPNGGSVSINGTYGTLIMSSTGAYSYEATAEDPNGVEHFVYTLTDSDGDSDTATLDITVSPDDQPVAVAGEFTVDETDMNGGSVVFEGQLNINYGADGAGSVNGNGTFSAGDSLAGGQLTSGGVPVVVNLVGAAYIGTAGGETVFTLKLGNDGSYTFQLLGTLDHADGTDPNDSIQLNFGVTVADSDGDTATGQIVVHVLDDAPVAADDHFEFAAPDAPPPPPPPPVVVDHVPEANNDSYTFTETQFLDGGAITLNVLNNDIMSLDGGTRIVSAVFIDTNGNEIGSQISLGGNSSYKILEFGNNIVIDAWNKDSNSDDQTMRIKYVIEDADGDQSTAIATVKQNDNTSPLVLDLDGDGIELLNVSAGVQFDMGSDGQLDNTSWVGADDGLLAIDRDNSGTIDNQSELFGTSDTDGFSVLSQYDSNNDGKIDTQDALWAQIVVWQDKNSDGISTGNELIHLNELNIASISLAANEVSYFLGDSYVSHESTFTYGDGSTGEIVDAWFSTEGTNGDDSIIVDGNVFDMPDAAPEGALVGNLLVNDNLSEDDANTITSITVGGQTYQVAANGETVVQGQYGTITIEADGSFSYLKSDSITDTVQHNVQEMTYSEHHFTAVNNTFGGVKSNTLGIDNGALDVAGNVVGQVSFVSSSSSYSNSLGMYTVAADGTLQAATMLAQNGKTAAQTSTSFAAVDGESVAFFIVQNGNSVNNNYNNIDLQNGTLNFVYNLGQANERIANIADPGAKVSLVYNYGETGQKVLSGTVFHTTENGSVNNLNVDGQVHVTSGLATAGDDTVLRISFEDITGLGDKDYNDMVIDVKMTDVSTNLDGNGSGNGSGNGGGTVTENITYTLTDDDGDSTTANITIDIPVGGDGIPVIVNGLDIVDETGMSSVLTENGHLMINYNGDAPGSVNGTGTFNATGSVKGGVLAHNGVAINVTYDAGAGTYTGKAGALTVFTLHINADGTYEYKQYEGIDHADGNNVNDAINLNFGVAVSDNDGDTTTTDLTILVQDDAANANNDDAGSAITGRTLSGNVLTNDTVGADDGVVKHVESITFAGKTVTITGTDWNTITSNGTTLRIKADGSYQFTSTRENTFTATYKIVDGDGDSDTATLTARFTNPPPPSGDGGGSGSPLVLDLDGDGIELTTLQGGVQFDIGPDGVMDQTAWVSSDDALLAIDLNGDGLVNGHDELFGRLDQDGFNVLAAYNSNGDGVIDVNDGAWDSLVAWRDMNQDGKSSQSEIFTLSQLGINSIALAATATDYYLNGSWIPYASTFTYEDGSVHQVVDAWFSYITLENWMNVVNSLGYDQAVQWLDSTYAAATMGDSVAPTFDVDAPIVMGTVEKIYEDGLDDNTAGVSDNLNIFYGDDQPGDMTGNGKFNVSGSMAGGILTHDGVAVEVTYDAQTGLYTGMAGDETVFTMAIHDDGSYNFQLLGTLDHANTVGNLDNNIILQFGVNVTDNEGDTAESVLRMQVINEGGTLAGLDVADPESQLYGMEGADTFFFQAIKESADTLHSFNKLEGDAIDISALLQDQDGVTEAITDFVYSREENGSTIISVDTDGAAGPAQAVDIVQVDGVTGLDVQELFHDGNLIV
jgi:T1SS-143 domain-containing protein